MRGVCALTHDEGEFIASHLIPKALTRPAKAGRPLIQIKSGEHPIRRWDSWFDDRLVTVKGENILTDLDTWAIRVMRERKMVWSGWGGAQSLHGHFSPLPGSNWGIRKVSGIDTQRLRLFFLSLLWRAAATSRAEFAEIDMPVADLETLRQMLLVGQSSPVTFYWISLTQLSTKGVIHNMPPIAQFKEIRNPVPGLPHRLARIYRFYFDGLIAHVHLPDSDRVTVDLSSFVIGAHDTFSVSTVTYESSFQRENLDYVRAESLQSKYPF